MENKTMEFNGSPIGYDWFMLIYINLAFIAQIVAMYYFTAIKEIKDNWPKYRCNPMYMPLSDNMQEDFTYCVQSMQLNYMGYLLQPITYVTSSLSAMGAGFVNNIDSIRSMTSNIRTFSSTMLQGVFSVFLNIVVSFQKMMVSTKDLVAKQLGVMVTMMYIMDGSMKTMNSTWGGPPGQMVRALGKCFHPDTKVKLNNGTIKMMKDLILGDVLENGIKIMATMKIDNANKEHKLYKLENMGVDGEDIYVTGKHMVYLENEQRYVYVEEYPNAILQEEVESEWFSCLITYNHNIPIGKLVFWDWEDDYIAY
jgi:hypothetical protein